MPRSFATATSAAVTARTWVTPPATPSVPGTEMVCTESMTSSPGLTASRWPRTASRSVSAARNSRSCNVPMRSARRRTWLTDSSPETTRLGESAVAAHCWATSSSSVDLPTPGSPASRTTDPGTMPPPSTRSSSGTPVGLARAGVTLIVAIGRAGSSGVRGLSDRSDAGQRRAAGRVDDRAPLTALGAAAEPLQRPVAAHVTFVGGSGRLADRGSRRSSTAYERFDRSRVRT